jgi:hypothetical protein
MLSRCSQKRRTDPSSDGVSNPASELRCNTVCASASSDRFPTAERGRLDGAVTQWPPAGVGGELAQE